MDRELRRAGWSRGRSWGLLGMGGAARRPEDRSRRYRRGRARACPTDVEEQLLRIGQEAVNNAMRHASPRQIRVTIDYGPIAVSLRVADDGRGFVDELTSEPTGEHWGLVTMKERVARIGGRFQISSTPGQRH